MKEGIWSSKYLRAAADGMFPLQGDDAGVVERHGEGRCWSSRWRWQALFAFGERAENFEKVIGERRPVRWWDGVSSRLEPEGGLYYENAERSNYTQMVDIKRETIALCAETAGNKRKRRGRWTVDYDDVRTALLNPGLSPESVPVRGSSRPGKNK